LIELAERCRRGALPAFSRLSGPEKGFRFGIAKAQNSHCNASG